MKSNQTMSFRLDPEVDRKIEVEHQRLMETARKNGRHLAEQNRPEIRGEKLYPYINDLKSGYEKLAAEVLENMQPAANYPESKIESDLFKMKCEGIDNSLSDLERKNREDNYHLDNFNPKGFIWRLVLAVLLTLLIYIGEAAFNTKAFLITGDNFLFALVLSFCLSLAVLVFSHLSMTMAKAVRSVVKRRLIIGGAILFATGLFIALAILRSRYLQAHEITVEPKYFVMINLFFFIVACLISYFILPTWKEFKENGEKLKIYKRIVKRKKEIKGLNNQKAEIFETIASRTIKRSRITYAAKYVLNRVQKMFRETLAVFISTNLNFRKDGLCPNAFNDHIDDISIDIDGESFTQLKLNAE